MMAIGIILPIYVQYALPIGLIFLYIGLSMMLEHHTRNWLLFRVLPLIICVICFWVFHKYAPQSQSEQTQWYLQIDGVSIIPMSPQTQISPFRIIPIINGKRYSYPTNEILITATTAKEGTFPIPVDIKPPYRISFEGIIQREGNKTVPLYGNKEDIYKISQLPCDSNSYEIFVHDSTVFSGQKTKLLIDYEIIKGD